MKIKVWPLIISLIIVGLSVFGLFYLYNLQCDINLNQSVMGQDIPINLPSGINQMMCIMNAPINILLAFFVFGGLSAGIFYLIKSLVNLGE